MKNDQERGAESRADRPHTLMSLHSEFAEINLDTEAFSSLMEMLFTAMSCGCNDAKEYNAAVWYISCRMHDHAQRMDTAVDLLHTVARGAILGGAADEQAK